MKYKKTFYCVCALFIMFTILLTILSTLLIMGTIQAHIMFTIAVVLFTLISWFSCFGLYQIILEMNKEGEMRLD